MQIRSKADMLWGCRSPLAEICTFDLDIEMLSLSTFNIHRFQQKKNATVFLFFLFYRLLLKFANGCVLLSNISGKLVFNEGFEWF